MDVAFGNGFTRCRFACEHCGLALKITDWKLRYLAMALFATRHLEYR